MRSRNISQHPSFKNLTGQKFGKLTIQNHVGFHNGRTFWKCSCECGTMCEVSTHDLCSGKKRSCGCLRKENKSKLIHGKSKERIHKEWRGILHRCKNPSASHYENYGGRGISVCEEWANSFIAFYNWAINNGYSNDLTLDRIDNDGDYCPENCRWVTHMENCHNRGVRKDSKTGCPGVHERKLSNGVTTYRAYITTNYKRVNLGTFSSLDEAIKARKNAEKEYWGKEGG